MPSAALPAAGSWTRSFSAESSSSTAPSGRRERRTTRGARRGGCRTSAGAPATAVIPQGLTDSVTWMFADGPRQAISMESTFTFGAGGHRERRAQAARIASAGAQLVGRPRRGAGLHAEHPGGVRRRRAHPRHRRRRGGPRRRSPISSPVANTGRSADLDAIATYLALGVRAPISPVKQPEGRQAGSRALRGGGLPELPRRSELDDQHPGFHPAARRPTRSSTPSSSGFSAGWAPSTRTLFTDGVSNEIRANNVANVQARGSLGFNVPSLIAVFASAPYLHSGAAPTLTRCSRT